MKTQSALLRFLILMLILSTFSRVYVGKTQDFQSSTDVYIDPPNIIDLAKTPGENVTVAINITNVEGLNAWRVILRYNPVLLYTNSTMVTQGSFLKRGGSTYFVVDISEDYVELGALLTSPSWVDGNGTLATITFRIQTFGESVLDLYYTKLLDLDLNLIPHDVQDGYFRNVDPTRIPVAKFTYFAQAYNVTFNASLSYDPDGTVQKYKWFWGGNQYDSIRESPLASDPIIWHKYPETSPPKEENATVRLIVVDNENITSSVNVSVIVFGVAKHDIAATYLRAFPSSVMSGQSESVNVTVTNMGNQIESFNVTVYRNVTETDYDNITNTQWEAIQTQKVTGLAGFEERTLWFVVNTTGFSSGMHVIKAEADTVQNETDTSNNFKLYSFEVTAFLYPPAAWFSYSPSAPKVGETLVFNATQSFDADGEVTGYLWDFGDDNVSEVSDPIVVHVYGSHGTFNVSLTVFDSDQLSNATWQLVKVFAKPVADFTYSPTSPLVNEQVLFNASASSDPDGSIAGFSWDFGDGNITNTPDPTVTHTYATPENRTVTLTVVDSDGLTSTLAKTVLIKDAPKTSIFLYVFAAIAIVAVAPLLFYLKRRKRVPATTMLLDYR